MVHLAHLAAPEESNTLTNETALQIAWFNLARGAMAQTDMLERFENLQNDYDALAETHAECSVTVQKLVTARLDLEHNARLYTNVVNRYKALKEEHDGCDQRVKTLDDERNSLSRMSTEGAKERQKLTTQLSQAEVKNFDCIQTVENFDAYSDKKLYPMYDKLFETEYPYVIRVASGFRHSVADLLKVHPDPAPSEGNSALTISKALG
ncbi:hypothetical protein Tco_1580755 [Tanacetum coccineum]